METPDGVPIVPTGKAGVDPRDVSQAVEAQLPLFRNPRMAQYLSYRTIGFSIRESLNLAGVTQHTLNHWRNTDEEFADYEANRLNYMQVNLAHIVGEALFLRCMTYGMILDEKVLKKGAFNRGGLTEFEQAYIKTARKEYGPQGLLAWQKASRPDDGDGTGGDINFERAVIIVGGKEVDSKAAQEAGAEQLLELFRANQSYAEHPEVTSNIVEGELVGDDDGDRES